ncbi:MAG: 1-deoxy-D-xylulose-5-phosphate synthase [Lentisphaeria bacterium]
MANLLEKINSPEDLRLLSLEQCELLSGEIRELLIKVVSEHGGHLGPNLGVVELTIALLRSFSPPSDKIIFDVGHQSYVYKILTGRADYLASTLRGDDGCCGFPNRDESIYDAFGTGHAGTAISAALGMAVARDYQKKSEKLIAVVGDGALGCGISLEALNHISEVTKDFVIVLNDNEMSIGANVGALSKHLDRIIATASGSSLPKRLRQTKRFSISKFFQRLWRGFKKTPAPSIFDTLGVNYLGPVNGHDFNELSKVFEQARNSEGPVLVHILTEKGKGYHPAQQDQELFHGLGSFNPKTGKPLSTDCQVHRSYTLAFGDEICQLAQINREIVAISAGMVLGTGLAPFRAKFPERIYDVGIAEEHAVIFAAGLAINGLKPLVALYGTFAQRAFDCIYHDICLQNLPVVFTMDRAGIVTDGPTHHGIYDFAFWQSMPNLIVMQPASEVELRLMLNAAFDYHSPVIIRYPKNNCPEERAEFSQPIKLGEAITIGSEGSDGYLWAVGHEVAIALEVKSLLENLGIYITVVNPRFTLPMDENLLINQLNKAPVFTLEDHVKDGGFASVAATVAVANKCKYNLHSFGWPKQIIPWGSVQGIRSKYQLTASELAKSIKAILKD